MVVLRAPRLEFDLGIEVYASKTKGVGGVIRCLPEDFVVEEVLTDGSKASIQPLDKTGTALGHGRYLVCVLIKRGWDTLAAIEEIANQVGVSTERIDMAGIKDTRALTAQHISLGGVPAEKVTRINLKDIVINPVCFSSEKISSRLLFGNRFNVKVKSIEHSAAIVQKRIEKTENELMSLGGIVNFFGHQRFGTVRPLTHKVGRHLVKGAFEDAAHVFLSEPSPYEHAEARNARESLRETHDFRSALKFFPRELTYERRMLRHLSEYPRDFLGSFRMLSPRLRVFFVQAYQSYLFNRFLSRRISQGIPFGRAEMGDYVVNLDEKGLPSHTSTRAADSNISEINEEISEGKMAVGLPLIGFKQASSSGVQGEIEKEVLEEQGIQPDDFRILKMPEASVAGSLRPAVAPVLSLRVEVTDEPSDRGGLAAAFSFTLHKGSYATVLLRELMKPKDVIQAGF